MAMTHEQYSHLEQHLHEALRKNLMGAHALFRAGEPCCLLGWAVDAMGVSYGSFKEFKTSHVTDDEFSSLQILTSEQEAKVWEFILHLDPIAKERVDAFSGEMEDVTIWNDSGEQKRAIEAFLAIPELQPS